MKICEKCKKTHEGNFGSGRFCSRSCANSKEFSKETKEKISLSVLKNHPNRGKELSSKTKEKIREAQLKSWNNNKSRKDLISKVMKDYYSNPENKKSASLRSKDQWKNEVHRKNISEKSKKQLKDPENLRKFLDGNRRKWKDKTFRSKMIKNVTERMLNGQASYMLSKIQNPSKPQEELYWSCKIICESSVLNYPSLNYSIDIAIPDLMIAIEYDGSYWHQNQESDVKRQKQLEELGWKFIRYKDRVPSLEELEQDIKGILN